VRPVNAAASFTRVLGRHGYADKWDDPVWKIGFTNRFTAARWSRRMHRYPAIISHGESHGESRRDGAFKGEKRARK